MIPRSPRGCSATLYSLVLWQYGRHMEGQSAGEHLGSRSVETTRMARDERGRASVPAGDTPRQPRLSAWGAHAGEWTPLCPRRIRTGPRVLRRMEAHRLSAGDPGRHRACYRGLCMGAPTGSIRHYSGDWSRHRPGAGDCWAGLRQYNGLLRSADHQSNGVYGLAFLVSVAVGRPLAGVFAQETYPFPPEVKASHTFRNVFSRISLVWATYLLLRTGLRFFALLRSSVEFYLVIQCRDGYSVHRCAHELVDLVRHAELPTKREGVGAIPHWSLTVFGRSRVRPAPAHPPSSGSSQLGRVVA